MANRKHLTAPVPSKDMPKGIPYIIGNEAAERFSFYGMKGIHVVFMTQFLHLLTDDPDAITMNKAEAIELSWVHFLGMHNAYTRRTLSRYHPGKCRTVLSLSLSIVWVTCVWRLWVLQE